MRTIRWGIIGVGDVTEVKSGPGFYKADHSALVAVMRRDADKARDYARRHNVPRWYDDAAALIHDPEVDAVYIATPPHVHKDYTLMAAAAGKPVYCEKPMALDEAECQAMIDACARAGVPLWVAYYRRTLPRFVKVKELVDAGAIGAVQSVVVRLHKRPNIPAETAPDQLPWRVQPEISGGGLFVDVGSHTIDLLDHILGPVARVCGWPANLGGRYPAEDNVSASFQFESGVVGVGSWCFNSAVEVDETILVGNEGQLSFASFAEEPVRLITAAGEQTFSIPHPAHVQQPLIQTMVDELNGVGHCPSTGISGARATRFIDAVLRG